MLIPAPLQETFVSSIPTAIAIHNALAITSGYLNNDAPSLLLSETLQTPLPSFLSNTLSTFDYANHPITTIITSYFLVTASDMIPFLPCQPLAIALGAQLGFSLAFPITAVGQTSAGIIAFLAARRAANSSMAQEVVSTKLSSEAQQKLQELKQMTDAEEQGDDKILLALIGLRLAPFFPFSAGNYLLGGSTSVPLRLFVLATLLGCFLSNFLSVSVGAGGAWLLLDGINNFP